MIYVEITTQSLEDCRKHLSGTILAFKKIEISKGEGV